MRCPRCAEGDYGFAKRADGIKHRPTTTKRPSVRTLERWEWDSTGRATDGCTVEPDGVCEHGHHSWLIVLGLI